MGYKHTPESLDKMRNFILSDEVRERKALSTLKASAANKHSIVITDSKTNEVTSYDSLTDAGKALGVSRAAISQAVLKNRLIKKTYAITRL